MKHNCPSQKCSAALLPLSSLIHTLCSSPTPYQIPHTVIWMRWSARCLLCQWTCCLEQTTKSGKCTSKIWQSASAVVLPQFQHCEWAYAKSVSAYGTSAVSLDVSNCVWMQSVQVREFTQRFSLTSQVCLCTEEEEVKHCNSCHKKKKKLSSDYAFGCILSKAGPTVCTIKEVSVSLFMHMPSVTKAAVTEQR